MKAQERKRATRSRAPANRSSGPPAAESPSPAETETRGGAVRIAALFLLTLLAYSNSFFSGFVLDNRGLILKNPTIRAASAANVGLIFNHTYWWPNGESGLYRPFATLSYLFNYAILGNADRPAGYHWINFLLHAANVLLVYWLVLRLARKQWPAFFVAALWAVHPVLSETVTNVVGRSDLLAATGVLGGLACYLKSVESSGTRRLAWLAALAAITAIGAFSKETGVVVILAIVLYELTFRRKWTGGLPSGKVWLGLTAAAIPIAIMLWSRHEVLAVTAPMEIPFTDNPIPWAGFLAGKLTALYVIGREFALILWPATLSADYSWAQIPLVSGRPAEWIGIIASVAIVPAAILLYRWNRVAFFFFALGLIWLAPVSNLPFATGVIMAERLLYLTALGVMACVVFGAYALSRRYSPRNSKLVPALLSALTLILAARTWARNPDWTDDLSIAQASVRTSPHSFKTHDLLANVLFASDPSHSNLDRVISESEKSLAILDPLPLDRKPPDPYLFAANCYMLRHAWAKAIPVLVTYTLLKPADPDGFLRLSTAYLELRDSLKAASAAGRARSLNPLDPQAYAQIAEVDASTGKLDDAAVSLIEGIFVTDDKTLRHDLIELYQSAMDPKSCVLAPGPNGPAIDPACPAVHAHACAASAYVVSTLQAAGQPDVAERRRRMFANQFHCQ